MNPLNEAFWTARALARPAAVWGFIALFVSAIVIAVTTAFFYFPQKEKIAQVQKAPAKTVSTGAYVASFNDLIECVSSGPDKCAGYEQARKVMGDVIPRDGMKYTKRTGEQASFVWDDAMKPGDVKAVADAIGASSDVKPSAVTVDKADQGVGLYDTVVGGKRQRMRMSLDVGDQTVKIISVEKVR